MKNLKNYDIFINEGFLSRMKDVFKSPRKLRDEVKSEMNIQKEYDELTTAEKIILYSFLEVKSFSKSILSPSNAGSSHITRHLTAIETALMIEGYVKVGQKSDTPIMKDAEMYLKDRGIIKWLKKILLEKFKNRYQVIDFFF